MTKSLTSMTNKAQAEIVRRAAPDANRPPNHPKTDDWPLRLCFAAQQGGSSSCLSGQTGGRWLPKNSGFHFGVAQCEVGVIVQLTGKST